MPSHFAASVPPNRQPIRVGGNRLCMTSPVAPAPTPAEFSEGILGSGPRCVPGFENRVADLSATRTQSRVLEVVRPYPASSEASLVREIMVADVHTVGPSASVRDVAAVMEREGHGCVIVVAGSIALGIVTERDIVHRVTAAGVDPSKIRAQDIMSTPLITIRPEATVREAAQKMSSYEIRRIVVVSADGRIVGLLTVGDIAGWLAKAADYSDPALNAIARLKVPSSAAPYR